MGEKYNEQEQVLSNSYSSRALTTPGSSLNFQSISTTYDMTGLDCDQVKFLCTEFSRNPSSSVAFEVSPEPSDDMSALRDCMDVPEDLCRGEWIDEGEGEGRGYFIDINNVLWLIVGLHSSVGRSLECLSQECPVVFHRLASFMLI